MATKRMHLSLTVIDTLIEDIVLALNIQVLNPNNERKNEYKI